MKSLLFFILLCLLFSCYNTGENNSEENEYYCYDDTIVFENETLIYTRTNLIDTIAIDSIM